MIAYWAVREHTNGYGKKFRSAIGILERDIGLLDISKENVLEVYKGDYQQVINLAHLRDMGTVSQDWKNERKREILQKMERIK